MGARFDTASHFGGTMHTRPAPKGVIVENEASAHFLKPREAREAAK